VELRTSTVSTTGIRISAVEEGRELGALLHIPDKE